MKCYNSGSAGNLYSLTSKSEQVLLLDAGFTFQVVKSFVNFKISNVFLVASHFHFDHSKGIKGAISAGIDVYASEETHTKLGTFGRRRAKVINSFEPVEIGEFTVMAFDVKHDVPCLGFYIRHEECGNICYITDTTYLDLEFEDVNHWLIEANFCRSILLDRTFDGSLHTFLAQRVIDYHLSIQDCQKILRRNNLSETENIILLHLSDRNSNAKEFREKIIKQTGKQVYIAEPGLTVDFSKDIF